MFLGAFFWVNLMVSVVIDHYLTLMGESSGNQLVTEQQKMRMNVLKLKDAGSLGTEEQGSPPSPLRASAYWLVSEPRFDTCVMGAILLNILVMSLPYHGASK